MHCEQVEAGVWRAGTRFVNWYLVDGGPQGLTVVDAGLPGYGPQLDGALQRIGRTRSDVAALLLTHGHVDHVGTAQRVAATGAAVYLHAADVALAANPRRNRTDRSVVPYLRWPATWAFVAHCVQQGALSHRGMPPTVALDDGAVLDVPGHPLVTHTPGHTDGSCVFEFRDHGVVFVGDLLCTVSPVMGARAQPQLQTRGSNTDSEQAFASLDRLAGVHAPVVLPGHGSPWRDGVEAAVRSARHIGCR